MFLKIIELYFARYEQAVAETDAKYGRLLFKLAYNILGNIEDSRECVSDTYFTAWNQIPPTRPQRLLPYLGRITRCLALNRYDYLTAQKRNSELTLQLSELEDCLSGTDSPELQYESGELAGAISAFLRTQSADARNIFIRRYWFSDSIAQIAERFQISESKVKTTLFRTRNRLRKYLEGEGYRI